MTTGEILTLGLSIILTIVGATAFTSRALAMLASKIDTLAEQHRDLWHSFDEHKDRDDRLHEALCEDIGDLRSDIGRLQGKVGNGRMPG